MVRARSRRPCCCLVARSRRLLRCFAPGSSVKALIGLVILLLCFANTIFSLIYVLLGFALQFLSHSIQLFVCLLLSFPAFFLDSPLSVFSCLFDNSFFLFSCIVLGLFDS